MLKRTKVMTALIVPMALVFAVGCTKYQPRPINIAEGEYYEDEEYQKLSKDDREAYCRELADELIQLQGRSETAQNELTSNKDRIRTLTTDIRDSEREYANLSAQIDELTRQLQVLAQLPKTWTLQYGECLWNLAGYEEIYGDPLKWTRIWRANSGMIEDPDWVLAGWELAIPRDWPKQHTVVRDEWLAKIAGYWEVYDNWRDWPKLFEANKGQINDPDLIFPEQVLVIPR
ncbi:MAG: LysM peptidoglycan-binding domain-containing protein [Candidatus Krumholzibacteriota bacterium]|nr:LysM peptidoglycan-binding domain-containing protein [Candidatus Krumholzibacteriota bacterium]